MLFDDCPDVGLTCNLDEKIQTGRLIKTEHQFLALPTSSGSDDFKTDNLIQLVHPHSEIYVNSPRNPDYEQKIERVVRDHLGPLLLGFAGAETPLNVSLDWIEKLNPAGPRFIYLTIAATPYPIMPNNRNFIDCIKSLFSPNQIIMGGAELINENGKYSGCLGHSYEALRQHFNVNLDLDLCWKPPKR